MSITINLTPAEEERLSYMATQSGLAPEEMARKLVSYHLPSASPIEEMSRRIREWQEQDRTPTLPSTAERPGLTPTSALFQQWAEEDAQKTDEDEKEAEDQLWQDIEKSINDTHAILSLRHV